MQQQHNMQVEDIELNTMIKNQIMHAIMSLHTLVFRIITFIIPNISYLPIQVKKFAQNALKVLKWTFQVIIMTKKSEIIFFVTNDIGVSL